LGGHDAAALRLSPKWFLGKSGPNENRSDIAAKMHRGFFDLVICDIRAIEGQLDY